MLLIFAMAPQPKYKIHKNVRGNWHGYIGRSQAGPDADFGTDELAALEWLAAKLKSLDDQKNQPPRKAK
jgi:hypothetical protein